MDPSIYLYSLLSISSLTSSFYILVSIIRPSFTIVFLLIFFRVHWWPRVKTTPNHEASKASLCIMFHLKIWGVANRNIRDEKYLYKSFDVLPDTMTPPSLIFSWESASQYPYYCVLQPQGLTVNTKSPSLLFPQVRYFLPIPCPYQTINPLGPHFDPNTHEAKLEYVPWLYSHGCNRDPPIGITGT